MSQDETYIRAKLIEIATSIERMTELLNRMIEIASKIADVQESMGEVTAAISTNSRKIDELMSVVQGLGAAAPAASAQQGTSALPERGRAAALQSVLETLESQIREGMIASDFAKKLSDAVDLIEQRGGSSQLIVKMNRWVRILRTYSRVDPISPTDLKKLREDIRGWIREVSMTR